MRNQNKFRGCLIGGAAGDALGYEVEFRSAKEIFQDYGPKGITEYALHNGLARISDDTQMTLFTATGLLYATTRGMTRGIMGPYSCYIADSYRVWLRTQEGKYPKEGEYIHSWLGNIKELYSCRAPGGTCLSALSSDRSGSIKEPINHSKGCGGVMRVAPIGLYFIGRRMKVEQVDEIAAEAAALTHGHELGWLSAAIFAHIVYEAASQDKPDLANVVQRAMATVKSLYPEAKSMKYQETLLRNALALAKEDADDLTAIRSLGEGWVGEEALAIAVYCAVKYADDFEKALIAAVNHSGDSDSTGALTGNILGAYLGLEGIPAKFLENLELKDLILEVADDLYHDNKLEEYSDYRDDVWASKYIFMDYKRES